MFNEGFKNIENPADSKRVESQMRIDLSVANENHRNLRTMQKEHFQSKTDDFP
jgi:hypothetical protein